MLRALLIAFGILLLAAPTAAQAHPFSRDSYSIRQALRLKDERLLAVVILEIPADVVMRELVGEAEAKAREAELDGKEIDPKVSRAQVNAFNKRIWGRMAEGLSLRVGGEALAGSWKPLKSDANGKGGEGFFVYMVGFDPKGKPKFGDEVAVELANTGWSDVPMYYAGLVNVGAEWAIAANNARDVLGAIAETEDPDPTDPKGWSQDEALRNLRVTFRRK